MVAVLLQGVGGAVVRAAEHRADGAGAGEQGTGLVALHLQTLFYADAVAVLVGDVLGLTVDQGPGGGGQAAGGTARLHGAEFQQHLVGQGEQGVADEDGLGGAVHLPDGVAVPALFVAVHQVVVQQREVVDQLHGDGAGDAGLGLGAGDLRGEHREGGAYGLAAVPVRGVALGVDPAEVVGGNRVHGRCQAVDGRPQYRCGKGPAALQERGHVHRGPPSGLRGRGHSGHSLSSCCGTEGAGACRALLIEHQAASSNSKRWRGRGRPRAPSTASAALTPLRTALSMVAGHPVAVHAPAR